MFTRRKFLKVTACSGGSLVATGASYPTGTRPPQYPTDRPGVVVPAEHYFTAEERRFIEAAVDRLIPKDETGSRRA